MTEPLTAPADMVFNLKVPAPAVQLILAGLGQLPHAQVSKAFEDITQQVQEQVADSRPRIVKPGPGDVPNISG